MPTPIPIPGYGLPLNGVDPLQQDLYSPTGKQVALGLGIEIAGGMASQIAGAFTGPGYFVVAPVGGFLSSIAAQKVEGRQEISYGRAIVAGLANLIPGPAGKIGRGAKGLAGMASKEAFKGAAVGAADISAQAILDEKRLPGFGELAEHSMYGAAFGGILGGGMATGMRQLGKRKLPKILAGVASGETSADDIDRLIATNPEFKSKISAEIKSVARKEGITEFDDPNGISMDSILEESISNTISDDVNKYYQNLYNASVNSTGGNDPALGLNHWVNRNMKPSALLNREAMNSIRRSGTESSSGEQVMNKVQKNIERFLKKKTPEDRAKIEENINEFLNGMDYDSKLVGEISTDLDKYRSGHIVKQRAMISLLKRADIKDVNGKQMDDIIQDLENSLHNMDHTNRSYKMFIDRKWKPTHEMEVSAKSERMSELVIDYKKKQIDIMREEAEKAGELDFDPPRMSDIEVPAHIESKLISDRDIEFQRLKDASASVRSERTSEPTSMHFERPLSHRREVGEAQLAWLGEVKDPGETMFQTYTKSARIAAALKGDEELVKNLKKYGAFGKGGENGVIWNVKERDTVNLPSEYEKLATQFSGSADDVYVHRDVNTALRGFYYASDRANYASPMMNKLADLYSTMVGGTKIAKTLLNPASYAPQLVGNIAATAANGIMPSAEMGKDLINAVKHSFKSYDWIDSQSAAKQTPAARLDQLNDIERASELGLFPGSVVASDLRDTLSRGPFSEWVQKAVDPVSKAYNIPDLALRLVNWKGAQRQLKKVYPDLDKAQLEEAAARLVNDTYMNYGMISGSVKGASRVGILPPFVTFTAELMRNMWHQGRYAKQMAFGKFGADIGLDVSKANIAEMRKLGAIRLGTLATATVGAGIGFSAINKKFSGFTEEQEDQFGDTIAASWDQGKKLLIAMDKDGKGGTYTNPEYLVPHTLAYSAMQAGWRGDPAGDLTKLFTNNFLGNGSFLIEGIHAVTIGKDKNGRDISFNENEITRLKEQLGHFLTEAFEPGVFREAEKWSRNISGKEDALSKKSLLGRLFGFRSNKFNIIDDGTRRIKTKVSNLNNIRSRLAFSRKRDLPGVYQKTYQEMETARAQTMESIKKHYGNIISLGATEDEAAAALKEAGLSTSDRYDILTGGYTPMPMTLKPSLRDQYEALGEDWKSRGKKMKELYNLGELDRRDLKTFQRYNVQDKRPPSASLSPIEDTLKRMDSRSRLDRIRELGIKRGSPVAKRWLQQRLLTKDMINSLPL